MLVSKLKSLVAQLSKRGPHKVLRGDLAFAGIPGMVFTPEQGKNLPAVAFGHNWLVPVRRYADTLIHLASWGIVVAAPATEKGPVPSTRQLATDLNSVLDICTGVRLGPGEISVQPTKLGLVGHGLGAGAAVLAAREGKAVAAAALYPSPTSPPAEESARHLDIPGLILGAEGELQSMTANAQQLARAWAGPVVLRAVDDADPAGLAEGRNALTLLLGLGKGDSRTQKVTRTMLTGFLLHQLAGDKTYAPFSDAAAEIPKTSAVDPDAAEPREPESGGRDLSRIFLR
jgi:dienelactone hydrolase